MYSLGDYRRKVIGGADSVPADYFVTKSERPRLLAPTITHSHPLSPFPPPPPPPTHPQSLLEGV